MKKEIVKTVNGVDIVRDHNTVRYYEIFFPYGDIAVHFTTIKKAAWYIECGLYECEKKRLEAIFNRA